MGSAESVEATLLTPDEAALLSASTHYSEEEIHQLHRQFTFDVGNGIVPFTTFHAFLASLGYSDADTAAILFRGFDADRDGVITFGELARGLSAMTRGTNDEKLRFAYRMHDVEGTGAISRVIFLANMRCLHRSFGPLHPYHAHHATAPDGGVTEEELVATIMNGTLGDVLTFGDFIHFATAHPSCIRGLVLAQ